MGARNRVEIWLSYRSARLHIGWRNWFLVIDSCPPLKLKNSGSVQWVLWNKNQLWKTNLLLRSIKEVTHLSSHCMVVAHIDKEFTSHTERRKTSLLVIPSRFKIHDMRHLPTGNKTCKIRCLLSQSSYTVYLEYCTLNVPLSELGPKKGGGGGHTRMRVRGRGGLGPNFDDWRKSLALCLFCGLYDYSLCDIYKTGFYFRCASPKRTSGAVSLS